MKVTLQAAVLSRGIARIAEAMYMHELPELVLDTAKVVHVVGVGVVESLIHFVHPGIC